MSRPRREIAWVARAATPIAMSARSADGIGRNAERNWSARARSTTRSRALPRWVSQSDLLAAVLGLGAALDEPPPDEPVDEARGRGRGAAERVGEVRDGRHAAVGQHVQRRKLGEAEAQPAELRREADDELAPQRAAHRHPLRELARVRTVRRPA